MKKTFSFSIVVLAVMSLLLSCNSKQTADEYLKDDNQRKDVVIAIAHHQPYMSEMMQQMMSSDSCKQMMSENMMSNPGMMNTMMGNMMSMCNKDSAMCKMMMGTMQSQPNVMKSMKGMCDMNNMNMEPKKDQQMQHH